MYCSPSRDSAACSLLAHLRPLALVKGLAEKANSHSRLKDLRTLINSKDFYESNKATPARIGLILS
ncbi:uncharacterized protein Dvir_GJ26661, isoform C [Drosophila virilis]|uniref:Uncharacterized protein, isoform C n=1 Tax=Drosophila virilis TaxID=7244 RepID=A0A0Q9WGS1_DROVI|nr:uncharacterized protein Dvir_GJ26661, isoform C [Drosophila virilis]